MVTSGTIPMVKRIRAIRHVIDHDFDVNLGVTFLLRECADEPKMQAAKSPETLARNILTMKGGGAEKELNWQAWHDAIEKYGADMQLQKERELRTEIAKRDDKIRELESDNRILNRETRDVMRRALPDGGSVLPIREQSVNSDEASSVLEE